MKDELSLLLRKNEKEIKKYFEAGSFLPHSRLM